MPEVLSNGESGGARMTTQDGTLILRKLLRDAGVASVEAYGTHSAKATLLKVASCCKASSSFKSVLSRNS